MKAHPCVLFLMASLPSLATAQNGLWHELSPATVPGPRWDCSTVYDEARDRLVLFNGIPSSSASTGVHETWEFDGYDWIYRGPVGPSGPEGHVRAAYDSVRNVTVAVLNAFQCETWEWDGQSWALRTPANAPSQRSGFAMAFDSLRNRTVLFGGRIGTTSLAETWEWDGTDWSLVSNGGPPPRELHAMAYDSANNRMVLFGGYDGGSSVVYNDTWIRIGTAWQPMTGTPMPAERSNHAMAFDSARGRVVMVGGRRNLAGFVEYQETWEWDGSSWANTSAPAPVPSSVGLAYDSLRERVVLYGGRFQFSNVQEGTHVYARPTVAASWTAYGSGCVGPAGTPLLVGLTPPRLGSTATLQLSQIPSGFLNLALGWVGFDDSQWSGVPLPLALGPFGFPGCEALLAPSGFYSLPNIGGIASWSIEVPFLPAFVGQQFYVQGGVLVLGFNPGGLVFSGGVAGVFGG